MYFFAEGPQTNPEIKISDAYLVSVDKDHIKEVGKKLKRYVISFYVYLLSVFTIFLLANIIIV